MKKKMISALLIALTMSCVFTGCNREAAEDAKNVTEGSTERVEKGEVKETEEGLIVTTDSGEKIVLSDKEEVIKNDDGTTTYTIDDGTKVTVNEETGEATVTIPAADNEDTNTSNVITGNTNASDTAANETTENNNPGSSDASNTPSAPSAPVTPPSGETLPPAGDTTQAEPGIPNKHTHSFKWVTTKKATCKTEGTRVEKCACGATGKTETIAKTGHTNTWEYTGTTTRTLKCSTCGATGITEQKYGKKWGYFNDEEAMKLFNWINYDRQECTTTNAIDYDGTALAVISPPPLHYSQELAEIAKIRASEYANCSIENNYNYGEQRTEGELLGDGFQSAEEYREMVWSYYPSMLSRATRTEWVEGACAMLMIDQNNDGKTFYPFWVSVFNSKEGYPMWYYDMDRNLHINLETEYVKEYENLGPQVQYKGDYKYTIKRRPTLDEYYYILVDKAGNEIKAWAVE